MAIYKPSNCIPFSNAIDLTENQDVTCELNTSNVDVTGYKMRVLDSKNNIVFEGNNYTNLNDPTLIEYYNSGLNGSELNLPLVVTDPGKSNENNIYFAGYLWHHWRPRYSNINDYYYDEYSNYASFTTKDEYIGYYVLYNFKYTIVTNDNKDNLGIVAGTTKAYEKIYMNDYDGKNLYFKNIQYFRISTNTVTDTQYSGLSDVYKKINGQFRVRPKPDSIQEAEDGEYYYAAGTNDSYSRILINGVSSWPTSYILTQEDYDSLDEVYYQATSNPETYQTFNPTKSDAIEDNVYYNPYMMVTRENISETEYTYCGDVYSLTQNVDDVSTKPSYDDAILNEYYYHESFNELNYLPDRKLSFGKYYYLDSDGSMKICAFDSNNVENYEKLSSVYVKVGNFDPVGPNQKPQNKIDAYNKYYVKRYFSVISNNPSTRQGAIDLKYYYININDESIQKIDDNNPSDYDNYIQDGVLYKYEGFIKYGSSVNSINYYVDEVILDGDTITITDEDYLNVILFLDRYILVSNTTEEFYINNIYNLYDISFEYTEVTGTRPSYGAAIANHYYYKSKKYLPITNEAMNFNSYANNYLIHDQGKYCVIDKNINSWSDAYDGAYYYINYQTTTNKPTYVKDAIKDGKYFYKDSSVTHGNPFIKITSLINQAKYNSLTTVYEINENEPLMPAPNLGNNDTPPTDYMPYFYKLVSNFYNGYKYQPYKWQINLKQGNISSENISITDAKWYDMIITSGTVIGSTKNRLQGILSEEIYRDYYVQLCSNLYDVDGGATPTFVGNRTRIRTYDHSFGYLYPQEGEFSDQNISEANYFQVYKHTNDPEYVSASRKVSYATTIDIDGATYSEHSLVSGFTHVSESSPYYTQIYGGEINSSDVTVDKYDTGATSTELAPLGMTLLIKNQSDARLNGVYWFVSAEFDSEGGQTTLKWQRASNGDSWADYIETAFFIEGGTYSGQNFVSDAQARNGTLNSTPLHFYIEKPIKIYPTLDDKYNKYYTGYENRDDVRCYFSPLFKNTNTRTFIRPFVGVQKNMRFQWGENLNDAVNIDYVDSYDSECTGLWYIDHQSLPYNKILTPNEVDYTISSYFKMGDEIPFYAYKRPYIDINILNATSELGYFGYPIIGNRYLLARGIYKQEQNKTWKYFKWDLTNVANGLSLYNGDPTYSGDIYQRFIGLEKDNTYSLSLLFEDEIGFVQETQQKVSVDVFVETENVLPISCELNCDLQTVDFSFLRNGVIKPSPSEVITSSDGSVEYSENDGMIINNGLIQNRDVALSYKDVDIDNSGSMQPILAPITNSFTLNSQHILNEYFQGEIITLSFMKDNKKYSLTIDSGNDVFKNDGNELEANENRNKMKSTLKIYLGDAEISNIPVDVTFVDVANTSMSYTFKQNKTPVFSLGKQDGTIDDTNCDYLYTTVCYNASGDKINGWYNLADSDYNELIPSIENNTSTFYSNWQNQFKYLYNCDSTSFDSTEQIYCPLTQNKNATITPNTTFGVWYDDVMKTNLQHDGNSVLITQGKSVITMWPNNSEESSFYWHDADDAYNFYKQVDLNATHNHSGRQVLQNMILTFNIGVDNYDVEAGTGEMAYNNQTVYCYIKEVSNE